ncbi:MAG: Hpt domain-containing protein [Myxococcaceae bacterium]
MQRSELAQFHQSFFDEAGEHAHTLEQRLLELEANPGDAELHNALFRAAHSIKGSSAMLGFESVTRLTHALETLLEGVRALRVKVDAALASLLLAATDQLSSTLDAAREQNPAPDNAALIARLEAAAGLAPAPTAPPPAPRARARA